MFPLPNTQLAEPLSYDEDGDLYVHSIFPTIQGEGPLAGMPAIFCRLYGCNLACNNCDTDYTSTKDSLTAREVVQRVDAVVEDNEAIIRLVVITGGEPFRQNLVPLVRALLTAHYWVQIETNGTLHEDGLPWHYRHLSIVCSPKTPKIHPQLVKEVRAFKYVLSADSVDSEDGLPLDVLGTGLRPARPPEFFPREQVYLQPEDTGDEAKNRDNLRACVTSCMKFGWRCGIQMHKIMGVE